MLASITAAELAVLHIGFVATMSSIKEHEEGVSVPLYSAGAITARVNKRNVYYLQRVYFSQVDVLESSFPSHACHAEYCLAKTNGELLSHDLA